MNCEVLATYDRPFSLRERTSSLQEATSPLSIWMYCQAYEATEKSEGMGSSLLLTHLHEKRSQKTIIFSFTENRIPSFSNESRMVFRVLFPNTPTQRLNHLTICLSPYSFSSFPFQVPGHGRYKGLPRMEPGPS